MGYWSNADLTGYDGGDIHLAFVYVGGYSRYGVDDLIIRSNDPIIPILSALNLMFFPATAIGDKAQAGYIQNIGSGDYSNSYLSRC